jgi:hypothetical protein
VAGKDASKQFWKYHNDSILKKYQKQLQVGSLDSKAAPSAPPATAAPEKKAEKKDVVKPEANSGAVAPQPTGAAIEESEPFDAYGDLIPYADPSWYQTVCLRPPSFPLSWGAANTKSSTTPPTSTKRIPPSAKKSANGSKRRSCPT